MKAVICQSFRDQEKSAKILGGTVRKLFEIWIKLVLMD